MIRLEPGDRLTTDLIALIAHVTAPLGEASSALARQAEVAEVVRFSATMLDVAVPPETPTTNLSDGPTPGRALIYKGADLVGELIVWIRSGRLTGLEQAWYTDEEPVQWPGPERVWVS